MRAVGRLRRHRSGGRVSGLLPRVVVSASKFTQSTQMNASLLMCPWLLCLSMVAQSSVVANKVSCMQGVKILVKAVRRHSHDKGNEAYVPLLQSLTVS
jgi:hypothetical protein